MPYRLAFARRACAPAVIATLLVANTAETADKPPRKEPLASQVTGNVFRPGEREPTDERVARLKVPSGFRVTKFAEGLKAPRMLAVTDAGDVLVTRRDPHNDLLLLRDRDGDGRADDPPQTVTSRKDMHGVATRGDRVYFTTIRELFSASLRSDGTLGEVQTLHSDLPDAGQHPNRTLRFSPDGELYLSIGSTSNAAPEPNPESATLLAMGADGAKRRVFSKGLRNTIGFDWHPQTKQLWGFDHGIDWLGDEEMEEELNLIEDGKDYGWPFVWGRENDQFNITHDPKGKTREEYAKGVTPPVLTYKAHAAPLGLVFYTGQQFPEEYRGNAFVTMHGSWNRKEPSGYSVIRVKFDPKGKPTGFEDFLTGFLIEEERAQFGRPCGIAVAKDGALLVSDDSQGVIYRIAYEEKR